MDGMAHQDPRGVDPAVSRRMAAQATSSTAVEVALRRRLHAAGLRYRLQRRVVPGAPRRTVDIVFGPSRVAVDVRGCFWHGCPSHFAVPATRPEWWADKIERNRQRDDDTVERLRGDGWHVEVVWEHDDTAEAAARIARVVRDRR